MRGDAVDLPMGSEIEKEEKKALSRFCTLGQAIKLCSQPQKISKGLQFFFDTYKEFKLRVF
jgi:hypothetical protein